MKDSHWKALSLTLTTALIVVVASFAKAQNSGSVGPGVTVEADKRRYILTIGHASAKEVDKYILYDSWDLAETEDIWVLEDPHKAKSKWIRMSFDRK